MGGASRHCRRTAATLGSAEYGVICQKLIQLWDGVVTEENADRIAPNGQVRGNVFKITGRLRWEWNSGNDGVKGRALV